MYPPVLVASMRLAPKGGAIVCDKMVPEGVSFRCFARYTNTYICIDPFPPISRSQLAFPILQLIIQQGISLTL